MNDHHLAGVDGIEPPDQWDEIVARSQQAPVLDAPDRMPSSRGRPLLPVGALVLVVAVLGVLVWVRVADRRVASGAGAMWGHRWQLVEVRAGDAVLDTNLVAANGGAVVLNATTKGGLGLEACNQEGGAASIVDGRLELGEWYSTAMGCGDPLDDLVVLDGAEVAVDGDRLVLSRPGMDGGPALRSEWRTVDTVPPEDAILGRRWTVTAVDGPSDKPVELRDPGPVVDLLEPGRVIVDGCGPHEKDAQLVEGKLEVASGPWKDRMVDCAATDRTVRAADVQAILDAGVDLRRDGRLLRAESSAGSFVAEAGTSTGAWSLLGDPFSPSTSRWVVVEAREADVPRRLLGSPVLTATVRPEAPGRAISISGCVAVQADAGDLDDLSGGAEFTPQPLQVAPECTRQDRAQAEWFARLLASKPTITVAYNRARILSPGLVMTLARIS